MKFPYAVKYNGVIYPANTEIQESKEVTASNDEVKKPRKKSTKGDK